MRQKVTMVRDDASELGVEVAGVGADEVGAVVAHLVHRVVGHVAVQRPVAGGAGDELDGAGGADRDEHGGLGDASGGRDGAAVGSDQLEGMTVEVEWVVVHRAEVAEPDANQITDLGDERRGGGNDLLLKVSTLKSFIASGSARRVPIGIFHSWRHERVVADPASLGGA